ncbi:acyl-CoA thioesterase [Mycolicibacterium insubricum]|uniref:Acyl-CoA thioesterase II n=1 Tax=Mycolicibacterium insubricum TaxID=444597 RepID=A0A1X0DCT9_9MYCO|nr:acyl-CoA thioesterase domain-containing protein [Mycolicibacterium insubricum]ORA70211.1 hypothetical protein BST26_11670 [Mycolicibacterium insubricum]
MAVSLNDILAVLRPLPDGPNVYLGPQPDDGAARTRVYGGQVAAQSALAAADTVGDRRLHSLHVAFLRPGNPRIPLRYEVTVLREGRTLSTRRVTVTQDGVFLMEALASFIAPVDGPEFAAGIPRVPAPESLPRVVEQLEPDDFSVAEAAELAWLNTWDMRYVDPPPLRSAIRRAGPVPADAPAQCRMWLRAATAPPVQLLTDPLLATGLLIYLTDWSVLDPVQLAVGRNWADLEVMASLDHAVWFHRPVDFSDWLLFDHRSPSASGGTGLGCGEVYNRSGALVCTVTQEGFLGRR